MFKRLVPLFALAVLGGALIGCGGDDKKSTGGDAPVNPGVPSKTGGPGGPVQPPPPPPPPPLPGGGKAK